MGVLSAFADAMETFDIDPVAFPRPSTLLEMAQTVGALGRAGYVVALDEFQYFSRQKLHEFTSHLQAVVDTQNTNKHIEGFLKVHGMYRAWTIERVAIAPRIDAAARGRLPGDGFIPQDLLDLTPGL